MVGLTDSRDVAIGLRTDITEEERGRPPALGGTSGALLSADGDLVGGFLAGDGVTFRFPLTD